MGRPAVLRRPCARSPETSMRCFSTCQLGGLGRKEACVSLWGVLMPGSVRKQISTNIACAGWYYPDKTFHRGETQPNTAVKHPPLLSYLVPEPLDLMYSPVQSYLRQTSH